MTDYVKRRGKGEAAYFDPKSEAPPEYRGRFKQKEHQASGGRPIRIAREGAKPVDELMG